MMITNKHFTPRKIALLKGGWYNEREVSLRSAKVMHKALLDLGFIVKDIDVNKDITNLIDTLKSFAPDVVCMNALHGKYVEDGYLQGLIELLGYPYTGSGVLASSVAMDKVLTRDLLVSHDLPVANGMKVLCNDLFNNHIDFAYPFVLKPINEGSSVGVSIIRNAKDLTEVSLKWKFGEYGLIEEYIHGRELSVALLNNKAIGMIELVPKKEFYDYEAKYVDGIADHVIPNDINKLDYDLMLQYCEKMIKVLGIQGVSRVDIKYDCSREKGDNIFILEANTLPGMTELSLVPDIAKQIGLSYKDLCNWMVQNPICRNESKS